jgi:hypothetical protein
LEIRKIVGLFSSGVFGIGFVAMALITLLPAAASKPNRLGYFSVCSYAPISTIILLFLSAISMLLSYKVLKSLKRSEMAKIVVKNEPTIA